MTTTNNDTDRDQGRGRQPPIRADFQGNQNYGDGSMVNGIQTGGSFRGIMNNFYYRMRGVVLLTVFALTVVAITAITVICVVRAGTAGRTSSTTEPRDDHDLYSPSSTTAQATRGATTTAPSASCTYGSAQASVTSSTCAPRCSGASCVDDTGCK